MPQKIKPVQLYNPYKFSAWNNGSQNMGNVAFAKMSFNTEIYDDNNNFASSTYTIPVTGNYLFIARTHILGSGSRGLLSLYKNGVEFRRGSDLAVSFGPGTGFHLMVEENFTAGDTVDVYSYGSAAIPLEGSAAAYTYFTGSLRST